MFNIKWPLQLLCVSFIGIHVVRVYLLSGEDNVYFLLNFALVPYFINVVDLIERSSLQLYATLVTHAFLHADFWHLTLNCLWMIIFGTPLLRRWGVVAFLILSLISIISGAAFHLYFYPQEQIPVIGASGMVSGLTAASAWFVFGQEQRFQIGSDSQFTGRASTLRELLGNRQALGFIVVWFLLNAFFGFTVNNIFDLSFKIAWIAHIGGFLAGAILFKLIDPWIHLKA